ncbi:PREDICTED: aminopeptidase N-like [Dinoponera quadriceps]|uniref:Aminopeptidase n=1 Tax=Dinoponera quadriceps TaxID=609295 RepID=A0A6P3X1R1_DINQU|nr:PREDICTED: aminopeptidase N-like [Dinoponera quadriceps]
MAFLRLFLNVSLIFIISTALPLDDDSGNSSQTKVNYRLPDNVVPVHYNIKLIPYIVKDNFTFDGETNNDIVIRRATRELRLHALELTIDEGVTSLVNSDGIVYIPEVHNYENVTEMLILEFNDELTPGRYILNLKFVGILNNNLTGFFRTGYYTEEDNVVLVAVTHFEATSARRAFPCWDEPALKATFNISIKHYRNYTALSNMPALAHSNESDEDDMIWTHFDMTPVMSTYLVAFVVLCGYVRVPNADETVNMWSPPDVAPYSTFAQQIAQRSRELLTQYTNSTDKVPKMDHVSSPALSAGAMENWGLIIYTERDFMLNEEKDTTPQKRRVAVVAAHEMSHQWFGNLVSPSWWTYVWLNEGFASFFEAYILDKLFDDWRMMDIYVIEKQQATFYRDVGKEMTSISAEVNSPEEIKSLFDTTTYGKAPVILRMLQHIITDEVFRNGLIRYLNIHQFNSTTSDDLWNALQAALDESNVPHNNYKLKEVMDTWITQRHYPVVRVIRNYDTGEVTLMQEHSSPYISGENPSIDDDIWWIPITFTTQTNLNFSNTLPTHWLRPQDQNITISGINSKDWLIVNLQQIGYYLVNYDEANWKKITDYLNTDDYTKIHVLNRAQIINDAYHLLVANRLNITIFLDIMNYMQKETEYIPWCAMFLIFTTLKDVLQIPGTEFLKVTIIAMMNSLVENVGYEENPTDSDLTKIKRLEALKWACSFDHIECRRMAAMKLNEHLANPEKNKVPPNLKEWTFCNGIMDANLSTWNNVMDIYAENRFISQYLSCSENPEIIIDYMKIAATNNTIINDGDYYMIYNDVVEKHANKDLIYNYLLANLEQATSRKVSIKHALCGIISNVHSKQKLDKINEFMNNNYKEDEELFKCVQEKIDERMSELLRIYRTFVKFTSTIEEKQNQKNHDLF